jgi:hypothetical protein
LSSLPQIISDKFRQRRFAHSDVGHD